MKTMSLNPVQLARYLWLHPCGHLWPLNRSHKFTRLSCAAIHLHHMEKVTLMTEEPRTNLSAHTVWFEDKRQGKEGMDTTLMPGTTQIQNEKQPEDC